MQNRALDYRTQVEHQKMHSDDRVLVLSQIDGEKTKATSGLVDSRLFKGGNKLHAIRDPQSYMWALKYDSGHIPEQLQQKFTKFSILLDTARSYYKARGLEIKEVHDWPEDAMVNE